MLNLALRLQDTQNIIYTNSGKDVSSEEENHTKDENPRVEYHLKTSTQMLHI